MSRKTALRVVDPKSMAFDMEEGLHFIEDMGEAVYAAAHHIGREDPLCGVFAQLGQLITDKAKELQQQREVVWRSIDR
jgi:hypothetical protein